MVTTEYGVYTYNRLLHDREDQRKQAIKNLSNNMQRSMVAKREEIMSELQHQLELENEKRAQERRNFEMRLLQEWAADDEIAKIEQEKLDRECRAHSERMKELLDRQRTKLLDTLEYSNTQIRQHYQEITDLICSNKSIGIEIYVEYETTVLNILSLISIIFKNCQIGNVSVRDINMAASFEMEIKNIKNIIRGKIAERESELKSIPVIEKQEIVKVIENPPPLPEYPTETVVIVKKAPKLSQYYSERSLQKNLELKEFLSNYKERYRNLLEDPSLKKFKFDCQKAVNTPVNAISSLSGPHIKDKFQKLLDLLNGNKVLVGDAYITAAQHPQGKAYCTDLLARKIVRQGELLVSSHPEAAFPIASVAVGLWAYFPDFGKLLCAHFYENCPYLIPVMMPQVAGQTDEEFYKMRGYRYNEEGAIEKQDQFLKRVSGIFKLYAAIWVTKMPNCIKAPHPHDLSYAWQWMAAFVNLNPEIDVSATLLCDFLTICGSDFLKYYKKQFNKILKYLIMDYMNELGKIDNGGPKTRLDVFVQNLEKSNHLSPPVGILSEYVW